MEIGCKRRALQSPEGKERAQEARQAAPGEIEPERMGKNEDGLSVHKRRILLLRRIFLRGCKKTREFSPTATAFC